MTTAARPTFDPAKGKAPNELTFMTSAKDLPSHTKLKTRKPGQGTRDEYTIEDLKRELAEAEQAHFRAKRNSDEEGEGLSEERRAELEDAKTRYIEMAQRLDAVSEDESSDDDDDDDGGGESEAEDSDSEDETAMLMRELEKIKRERAEEKAREEQDALERRLLDGESKTFLGENPLLSKQDFSVKRRWDDDVVFKNQAKGDDGKPQKRFVNDMLRSDFHRKFMKKYIH
ncbi:complexed with cef1p [Coemansia furcata]|uniref:Complexed with cef1p n=1 Tax=Coemansia furcata TaxID=417177 RepID=A0ACC1LPB8_9FUNG|nr:complexed with cef1p [Coemansia furcata]